MNLNDYFSLLVPLSIFVLVFLTKRIILSLVVGILLGAIVVKFSAPLEIPEYIFQKVSSVFYNAVEPEKETGEVVAKLSNPSEISKNNAIESKKEMGEVTVKPSNPPEIPKNTFQWKRLNWTNICIFMFLLILGILPQMFIYSGGIDAFVSWARKTVKSKRSSEFLIFFAGIVIFIDDQFNALTLGRSVRPLSDASGMSRERLAYIIDSTAAPVCILIPLSSWGAYIVKILEGSLPKDKSPLVVLGSGIGMNFYAWFALAAVFLTILWRINLPVMHRNINVGSESVQEGEINPNGSMYSLTLPVAALAFGTLGMIFLTGYLNAEKMGLDTSDVFIILNKTNTAFSVFFGGILALVTSFLTSWDKIRSQDYKHIFKQGLMISFPSVMILILAWAVGIIVRDDLQTGVHLSDFAKAFLGQESLSFIPLFLFVASTFIAFMTGTSWGCFAVMIPVGVDLALSSGGNVSIAIAAILSGAILGDHTSPISDTTILSSAGTGCSVQSHFITQLPYASVAAFSTFVSFLLLGIFGSLGLAFGVGGAILVGIFYFFKTRYSQELVIP